MNGIQQDDGGHATARGELTITHQGGGLLMACYEQVCVAVWETKPTLRLFDIQKAHLAATVAREPGRALFMCVVSGRADPPDQEIRDSSSKMIASHGKDLAACACVIEGSGFRAAITRTVLSGITMVIRTPVPFTFVESVEVGCKWFESRSDRGRIAGLAEKIARARAAATG